MAENKVSLFPVFDVPDTLVEDIENRERYAPAPLWDVERGEFITDGAQRTLYGSGYDAWVLWCTKSILTQRWAHDAYSANIGIEAEQAFKETDRRRRKAPLNEPSPRPCWQTPWGARYRCGTSPSAGRRTACGLSAPSLAGTETRQASRQDWTSERREVTDDARRIHIPIRSP